MGENVSDLEKDHAKIQPWEGLPSSACSFLRLEECLY